MGDKTLAHVGDAWVLEKSQRINNLCRKLYFDATDESKYEDEGHQREISGNEDFRWGYRRYRDFRGW